MNVDIAQECVAYCRVLIPAKHAIDCLRKLGAGALINAAGIYPDEFQALRQRQACRLSNFDESMFS